MSSLIHSTLYMRNLTHKRHRMAIVVKIRSIERKKKTFLEIKCHGQSNKRFFMENLHSQNSFFYWGTQRSVFGIKYSRG
jgi:hypothetical protein